MARAAVGITLGNGELGRTAASLDGVALLVVAATAATVTALAGPVVCYQLTDLEGAGVTEATDASRNERVWEHVKDFYAEAGSGAELHVLAVAQATTLTMLFTVSATPTTAYAQLTKLLRELGGRVRLIAVALNPTAADTTVASGVTADMLSALPLAQALADTEFELRRPVSFVLEARAFAYASTVQDLRGVAGLAGSSVSVVVSQDATRRAALATAGHTNLGFAQVGYALGRLARIPVSRNMGRVKSGKLNVTQGALSDGTAISARTSTDLDQLDSKGYIFYTKHPNRDGFFFNYDSTATPATDDYDRISRRRVVDKAARIAHDTYVEELLDDIDLDPSTGRLPQIVVAGFKNTLEKAVLDGMIGEVSAVTVVVNADQNVLATDNIAARLDIVPRGQVKTLSVGINFSNPANQ